MTGPDLFGVCIRVIGVIIVIYGAWYTLYGLRYLIHKSDMSTYTPGDYFTSGFGALAVGTLLVIGADLVCELAY